MRTGVEADSYTEKGLKLYSRSKDKCTSMVRLTLAVIHSTSTQYRVILHAVFCANTHCRQPSSNRTAANGLQKIWHLHSIKGNTYLLIILLFDKINAS